MFNQKKLNSEMKPNVWKMMLVPMSAMMLFAGCGGSDDPGENPGPDPGGTTTVGFSVNPTSLEFEYGGGTQEITVSAPDAWSAEADAGVTLSHSSGDATTEKGVKVNVTLGENGEQERKTYGVRFTCGESIQLTITQAAHPEPLELSIFEGNSFEVGSEDTQKTFTVVSNTTWSIESDNRSFVPTPADGENQQKVTVGFPANRTESEVVAHLTVRGEGVDPVTVTITQAAMATASDGTTVVFSQTELNWSPSGLLGYTEGTKVGATKENVSITLISARFFLIPSLDSGSTLDIDVPYNKKIISAKITTDRGETPLLVTTEDNKEVQKAGGVYTYTGPSANNHLTFKFQTETTVTGIEVTYGD